MKAYYYEWPYDYGGEIAITSSLSKSAALKRFAAMTREVPGCLALAFSTSRKAEPELVRIVSGEKIMLARAKTFTTKVGKPVFYGSLIENEEGVVLRGRFSVNCLQKVWFWSSGVILAIFELVIVIAVFLPENAPLFSWNNIGIAFAIPVIHAYTFSSGWHHHLI
jgi:hypothetical protein